VATVVGLVLLALAACGYASEALDREPGPRERSDPRHMHWPPWDRNSPRG
jgi:hypothetical protein